MMTNQRENRAVSIAETIRHRIESGGERIWRFADFERCRSKRIAEAISRLYRQGEIQRLARGLYYRPRQTAFGPSRPNMAEIRSLTVGQRGFSRQEPEPRICWVSRLRVPLASRWRPMA